MRSILLYFIFIFSLAGGVFAQDTTGGTITVKKNKKVLKKLDVINYPKLNSKEKEGLLTESSKYDQYGNIFLRSNYYNKTNESYKYNTNGKLTSMRVFNAYLKSYMYQDSLSYDANDRLIEKVRFQYNKLNAGGKDLAPNQKMLDYSPDSVIFKETYQYNASGQLIFKTNKKGKVYSCFYFAYDSAGNQIRERAVSAYGKDSLVVINITTYNDASEPVKYVEKNSREEIFRTSINKFDIKGNKLETLVYDGSFKMMQRFVFVYDKEANMIEQDYFDYRYLKGNKEPTLSSETKIKYRREFY